MKSDSLWVKHTCSQVIRRSKAAHPRFEVLLLVNVPVDTSALSDVLETVCMKFDRLCMTQPCWSSPGGWPNQYQQSSTACTVCRPSVGQALLAAVQSCQQRWSCTVARGFQFSSILQVPALLLWNAVLSALQPQMPPAGRGATLNVAAAVSKKVADCIHDKRKHNAVACCLQEYLQLALMTQGA